MGGEYTSHECVYIYKNKIVGEETKMFEKPKGVKKRKCG